MNRRRKGSKRALRNYQEMLDPLCGGLLDVAERDLRARTAILDEQEHSCNQQNLNFAQEKGTP